MKKYMLLLGILALFWSCQDSTTSSDVTEESKNENMEQHRPIYHFTPPSKWMNDPNGMVYYEGEYHLFYQYYPDGTVWGPMHWGHAVSEDLVNWEHLPIGLYPDSLGYIFSGSAVIDTNNTSGFGKDGQAPMVAIFTLAVEDEKGVPQRQGIAYSNDKGRTWTKYEGNPVIDEGLMAFRDPKVFWHQPTSSWVMSIAATTDNVGIRPDHIRFYSSPDLKNWRLMSDFGYDIGSQGGKWECPDLFKMKVEGTEEYKWVLLVSINPGGPNGGSATQYFIGDFDGERFTLDPEFEKKLVRVSTDKVGGELFENFESTYEGWQVAGTAFGNQPAKGTLAKQNPVSGFNGNALVNSFNEGDATQGKLTSAEFEVKSKYINFLIGGGAHEGKTCMNLLVENEVVRTSTGKDSEELVWETWEVEEFQGKNAKIEIVDAHSEGWGHINVDDITFSDFPAKSGEDKAVWLDYGRDNYAGVTWSNIPKEDGRRLFIGWMSNWDYATLVPTENWRSAMTLPRSLHLMQVDDNYELWQKPVAELQKLRSNTTELSAQVLEEQLDLSTVAVDFSSGILEFELELEVSDKSVFSMKIMNNNDEYYTISYDEAKGELISDKRYSGKIDFSDRFANQIHTAPLKLEGDKLKLQGFLDVASGEIFANDGKVVMTEIFFPNKNYNKIVLEATKGTVSLTKGTFHNLN